MTDDRSIELEVEVPGTPEEVWAAIATGPGVSSWYVPHVIEEAEGGAAEASFGPGMDVAGKVTVWDPPNRVKFEGTEDGPGLAFEWFVEARSGGSCVVRLVNSGFGTGGDWDDQFDAMTDGWGIFLNNLRLHLEHFPGQPGHAALPMGYWPTTPTDAWKMVTDRLGIASDISVGESFRAAPDGVPAVAGTIQSRTATHASFLVTEPAPGTGFLAAEGHGPMTGVSLWLYLYGDNAAELAREHQTAWAPVLEATD